MTQNNLIAKIASWPLIAAFALLLLLAACTCVVGDDDDDSDEDSDSPDDDDTGDDDFWPDDDSVQYDGLERIEFDSPTRAIPKGFSKTFSAVAHFEGGATSTQAEFDFSTSDESILTVDEDGLATGERNGSVALYARLGDVTGEAQVIVGTDIFFFDAVTGVIASYDRGRDRVKDDHFEVGGPVAQNPIDMQIWENHAYIVDSGDASADIVIVDLFSGEMQTLIVPGLDSPRDIKIVYDHAFVTGALSDTFARIDLLDLTFEIYELPEGCTPNGLEVMSGRAFVACNYFDADENEYGDPGRVADVNLESSETTLIDASQVNPGSLALSPDDSALYVVCTGDYAGQHGVIDEIDIASGEVVDSFALGRAPGDIAINSEGLAFIGENLGGFVYVVDTGDNSILRGDANPIEISGAWWTSHIRISPFSGHVFVGDWINAQTVIFDPSDFSVVENINTNNAGGYIFWE
jgi:hypothetical protein